MHSSVGGKSVSGKSVPETNHDSNSSEVSSSSDVPERSNNDDFDDDIFDSGQKLKRVEGSSNSSDVEDDLEDEGTIDEIKRRQKEKTYHKTDDFVVGDNNEVLEQTVHEVSAASIGKLSSETLQSAFSVFKTTNTNFLNVVEPTRFTITDEVQKAQPREEQLEDRFERKCYQCEIQLNIMKHLRNWIFEEKFKSRVSALNDDQSVNKAEVKKQMKILSQILNEMFIPSNDDSPSHELVSTPQYIIKYKSDIYKSSSIYTDDDIYMILQASKKYAWIYDKFQNVNRPVMNYYKERSDEFDKNILEFITNTIETIYSLAPISDLERFLGIVNPNSPFSKQKSLFGGLISEFLLSPEALAYKIDFGESSIDPQEPVKEPDARFLQFLENNDDIRETFEKEIRESVEFEKFSKNKEDPPTEAEIYEYINKEMINILRQRVISFASKELANNPILLCCLREQIADQLVVNTTPTERGEESPSLLPYGKYGPVKRIKNKIIASFANTDLWLLIDEAKQKGLLNVKIDYKLGIQNFLNKVKQYYLSQYGSQWDEIRSSILEQAFKESIWPQLNAETENDLKQKAADAVRDDVLSKLFAKLTQPPYTKGNNPLKGVSILSLCYHPDYPKEVGVVFVNPDGNVENHFSVHSDLLRNRKRYHLGMDKSNFTPTEKNEVEAKQKIIDNISTSNFDVVVICATCSRARDLYIAVDDCIENSSHRVPIIFAPSDAALVYAKSNVSNEEKRDLSQHSDVSDLVIIAASTARRVQNPISELTRLWTESENFLAKMPLHPFQSLYTDNKEGGPIHEACELACLKAVAIGGVDVSKLHSRHHRGSLQFIPGFGPNIANFVLNKFISRSESQIHRRINLQFELSGKKIYKNSIGFLRFPNKTKGSSYKLNLDGTMIHPDDYDKANDLVRYFLRNQNGLHILSPDSDVTDDVITNFYAQHTQINPNELSTFTSTDFNQHCQNTGDYLLEFIANELSIGPFESYRFNIPSNADQYQYSSIHDEFRIVNPSLKRFYDVKDEILRQRSDKTNYYTPMSESELFDSFITEPTIKENSISEFRIIKPLDPNGYSFLVKSVAADISGVALDQHTAFNGKKYEEIRLNTHLGVILQIDKTKMELKVSFNPSDLENASTFQRNNVDPNFDIDGEIKAEKKRRSNEEKKPHKYNARSIDNENFRNLTPSEAEAEILKMEVGKHLFRPSTKGNDRLILLIRFPAQSYGIYEIIERQKKNALALGQKLSIEEEEFEDLDDILWSFVAPIRENIEKVTNHRKWEEDKDEAETMIFNERKANPKLIPYRITSDRDNHGCVSFTWLGPSKLYREPIRITNKDFKFRHANYPSIDRIINAWKESGCKEPSGNDLNQYTFRRFLTDAEEQAAKENEEKKNETIKNFGSRY